MCDYFINEFVERTLNKSIIYKVDIDIHIHNSKSVYYNFQNKLIKFRIG